MAQGGLATLVAWTAVLGATVTSTVVTGKVCFQGTAKLISTAEIGAQSGHCYIQHIGRLRVHRRTYDAVNTTPDKGPNVAAIYDY
jgi:hypothetical protein